MPDQGTASSIVFCNRRIPTYPGNGWRLVSVVRVLLGILVPNPASTNGNCHPVFGRGLDTIVHSTEAR